MSIPATPTQDVAGASAGGATTMVFTITAAANGSTLFPIYEAAVGSASVTSITCTNVTFTRRQQAVGTNSVLELWQGDVSGGSSGTTVTLNYAAAVAAAAQGNITEWPGTFTLDAHNTTTGSSVSPATGTITPTASQNQLLLAAARRGGTFSSGPTNSFTALTTGNSTRLAAYRVVASTTGTYSTDWTFTASAAWESLYATFSQAAAPSGRVFGQSGLDGLTSVGPTQFNPGLA